MAILIMDNILVLENYMTYIQMMKNWSMKGFLKMINLMEKEHYIKKERKNLKVILNQENIMVLVLNIYQMEIREEK